MFEVIFYRDKKGKEPVRDYILSLFEKDTKDNRIKREKILDYIDELEEKGTRAGIPFVKHLEGKIWELRPLRDRILFFAYIDNKIVLLSHFQKKTQKTPKREIKKAEKLMNDYIARGEDDE